MPHYHGRFDAPVCAIVLTLLSSAAAQPPLISDFVPRTGDAGTNVTVVGSGFGGATSVMFTNQERAGFRVLADYMVVNDNEIRTTVPPGLFHPVWLISVFDPEGGTVSILPGFHDVTGNLVGTASSTTYVVRSGAVLTLNSLGSNTIFIESGGTALVDGGLQTVYVQDHGTFKSFNSGDIAVFAEPLADVTFNGGGGNTITRLPDVAASFIPEPNPFVVLCAASTVAVRRRRRRQIHLPTRSMRPATRLEWAAA
jgi:hypothetical protein